MKIVFNEIINNQTMFDLLPEECLFIIIQYLLDDMSHWEDAVNAGNQNLHKSWKLVCKHKYNLTPFNFKAYSHRSIVDWEKAPFTRVIPLMNVIPDVFNTNSVWTYILEQEFRKGKRYKRKPKDAKQIFKKRVQEIIHKRYVPLLCKEEELSKHFREEYIKIHKQINILYTALQSLNLQISKIDELDENDPLPPILPMRVKLPRGFIGRWNVVLQCDCFFDMQQLSCELSGHERNGKKSKKFYDASKKNIHQFKKIINQVMEEEVV